MAVLYWNLQAGEVFKGKMKKRNNDKNVFWIPTESIEGHTGCSSLWIIGGKVTLEVVVLAK